MEKTYNDPIIVTGVPRSGTSMVTGIFDMCGAFGGNTCGATPWNQKGQFENREIIQSIQKPYMKKIGCCPLGQKYLPKPDDVVLDSSIYDQTMEVMVSHGLQPEQIWYFKDCKVALTYQVWLDCFPNATWIIVDRPSEQIVESCLRQPFMSAYSSRVQWHDWVARYRLFLDDLERDAEHVFRVWSPSVVSGDYDTIKTAVEYVGLEWREDAVCDFVEARLFHEN